MEKSVRQVQNEAFSLGREIQALIEKFEESTGVRVKVKHTYTPHTETSTQGLTTVQQGGHYVSVKLKL